MSEVKRDIVSRKRNSRNDTSTPGTGKTTDSSVAAKVDSNLSVNSDNNSIIGTKKKPLKILSSDHEDSEFPNNYNISDNLCSEIALPSLKSLPNTNKKQHNISVSSLSSDDDSF